jgi:uncharacterized membrane protein YeiH
VDVTGLGLRVLGAWFAVEGALVAVDVRLDVVGVLVLAFATALAGGIIRDLLIGEFPAVLRIDVYATAALLGAAVMVAGVVRGLPRAPMMAAGAACCFVLRMLAVWQDWSLPHA